MACALQVPVADGRESITDRRIVKSIDSTKNPHLSRGKYERTARQGRKCARDPEFVKYPSRNAANWPIGTSINRFTLPESGRLGENLVNGGQQLLRREG